MWKEAPTACVDSLLVRFLSSSTPETQMASSKGCHLDTPMPPLSPNYQQEHSVMLPYAASMLPYAALCCLYHLIRQ